MDYACHEFSDRTCLEDGVQYVAEKDLVLSSFVMILLYHGSQQRCVQNTGPEIQTKDAATSFSAERVPLLPVVPSNFHGDSNIELKLSWYQRYRSNNPTTWVKGCNVLALVTVLW